MIFQKKSLILSVITLVIFSFSLSNAYDGEVHEIINREASEQTQILRDVLEKQLGLQPDPNKPDILDKLIGTRSIKDWIAYGGKAEDYGMPWDIQPLSTRAFNHFHDPLKDWDNAGLDSIVDIPYLGRYWRDPVSAILWGLDPDNQDFSRNTTGDWSWGKARECYFIYLTGKDFEENVVASTQDEREANFADSFRSLGQVMNLIHLC